MKTSRSIRKIAINDKRVKVDHILHHFTDDERVLNSKIPIESEVRPHQDFVDKFQQLKKHAIPIMEFSPFKSPKVDEKIYNRHIVTTLNIIESDEGMTVMISMNKYLSNGKCFSATSPRIELESYDYPKLADLASLVDDIIEEALAYVNGEKHGEDQLTIRFNAA
jgi:hypothetical protein